MIQFLDPGALSAGDAALLAEADAVATRAYAPYSNFLVGAAALGRDGRVYAGCNVENAAYPVGTCAEPVALSRAVAEGGLGPGGIEALAVTARPCGSCRQWIAEFRVERVLYRRDDGSVACCTPADLLPDTFSL